MSNRAKHKQALLDGYRINLRLFHGQCNPINHLRAVHRSRLPQWTTLWWFRNHLRRMVYNMCSIYYELFCWHIPGWCNRQRFLNHRSDGFSGLPLGPRCFVSPCAVRSFNQSCQAGRFAESLLLQDVSVVVAAAQKKETFRCFFATKLQSDWRNVSHCFYGPQNAKKKTPILRDTLVFTKNWGMVSSYLG